MSNIAINIKYLRTKTNLSQSAFGALFGLTRGMIASYELKSQPKIHKIAEIADYFGYELKDLLERDLSSKRVDYLKQIKANKEASKEEPAWWRDAGKEYMPALSDVCSNLQKDLAAMQERMDNLEAQLSKFNDLLEEIKGRHEH